MAKNNYVFRKSVVLGGPLSLGLFLFGAVTPALAVPSFSRQTGEECSACHVGGFGPQLTQHGRAFKLAGYGATASWTTPGNSLKDRISAMAVANYVHTKKDQTDPPVSGFNRNDNVALQEVSGFLAGKLAPGVGAFVQATWSGIEEAASLDNADIRLAREVKFGDTDAIVGMSLNNNPGVQDPWNTAPAWSFPYTSADLGVGRAGSPLLAGGLEQQVVGATGYIWLDDHVYAELGGYRSLSNNALGNLGLSQDVLVSGTAPYGRLAYGFGDGARNGSIGIFGLDAKLKPDFSAGGTDHYTDIGVDGTFQMKLPGKAVASVNAAYIHEDRTMGASFLAGDVAKKSGSLESLNLDGSYYWDRHYGFTVGLFKTSGSTDSGLFPAEADFGSRTGRPDSAGYNLQFDWTPFGQEESWAAPNANLRLGVQYTGYSQFNGADSNYDGFGRNAADNDTVSVFVWTAF